MSNATQTIPQAIPAETEPDPFARIEATARYEQGEGREGSNPLTLARVRHARAAMRRPVEPDWSILFDALGSWAAVSKDQGLDEDRCPMCDRVIAEDKSEELNGQGFYADVWTADCDCGECDGSTSAEARERLVRLALFNEVQS